MYIDIIARSIDAPGTVHTMYRHAMALTLYTVLYELYLEYNYYSHRGYYEVVGAYNH